MTNKQIAKQLRSLLATMPECESTQDQARAFVYGASPRAEAYRWAALERAGVVWTSQGFATARDAARRSSGWLAEHYQAVWDNRA